MLCGNVRQKIAFTLREETQKHFEKSLFVKKTQFQYCPPEGGPEKLAELLFRCSSAEESKWKNCWIPQIDPEFSPLSVVGFF